MSVRKTIPPSSSQCPVTSSLIRDSGFTGRFRRFRNGVVRLRPAPRTRRRALVMASTLRSSDNSHDDTLEAEEHHGTRRAPPTPPTTHARARPGASAQEARDEKGSLSATRSLHQGADDHTSSHHPSSDACAAEQVPSHRAARPPSSDDKHTEIRKCRLTQSDQKPRDYIGTRRKKSPPPPPTPHPPGARYPHANPRPPPELHAVPIDEISICAWTELVSVNDKTLNSSL